MAESEAVSAGSGTESCSSSEDSSKCQWSAGESEGDGGGEREVGERGVAVGEMEGEGG